MPVFADASSEPPGLMMMMVVVVVAANLVQTDLIMEVLEAWVLVTISWEPAG